ncbi:hypothetical protein B296_00025760 [Ensete ventricosum]|uniref:Uncharacterized protein n=1 Tax=Ensete ventricosum TaxID=4639 RepID=A0A427ACB3_ENSVE|nr:hypothetical protein B296_00025760 [Ensete ventricosum]
MHDNHTSMKNEDGVTKDYKLICLSSTWMRHSLPALPRLRLGGQDVDDEQASRLWRRRNRLGSPDDPMAIDFDDDVNLAKKLVRHETSAAKWMIARIAGPQRATTNRGEESAPTTKS